ncbi:hypothetical protein M758_4G070500 [Ceratodon purpureus]|nr:hypothetical protein M758_4G070500 [Ceratodon purpureus]
MAESSSAGARTLEYTPSWALATVATIFVLISIGVERLIRSLGHYLRETKRKPLYAALQRMKDELMLMGFISLTITILQEPVSKVCISSSVYNKWTPCEVSKRPHSATEEAENRRRLLATAEAASTVCDEGYEPFASPETLHQLHTFIIVLALFHVVFSCLTMLLALIKVYRWRKWEREAHAAVSQATTAELVRNISYKRQSTFVRYHTSEPWSRSRFVVWVVCFFQQFYVPRADYLALRLSFITTHNLKDLYDFHAYMVRTLEDEFESIVGISSWLWGFVVILWIFNIDGAQLFFWTSLIPVAVVFTVGTKLQHVVATLALENTGVPGPLVAVLLKPRDQLFWLNRPKLLLSIIHLVLFETATEFATFVWHVWQFGYHTCLLETNKAYVFGRLTIGLAVLLFSSYSTLPLYALVTQMGSSYKKAVLSKHVERVLRQWHKDAKQRLKVSAASATETSNGSTLMSSSSLILHFKSRISQGHSLQREDGSRSQEGISARSSPSVNVRMEEGSLDRSPSPTTAQSIWERRLRTGLSMERVQPSSVVKDQPGTTTTVTTMTTANPAKLPFLTPHPAFQSRALQRQSSAPIHEIHH